MDSSKTRPARAMIANTQLLRGDPLERIILTPDLAEPSGTLGIAFARRSRARRAGGVLSRRGSAPARGPDNRRPTVRMIEVVRILPDERATPPAGAGGGGGVLSRCRESSRRIERPPTFDERREP